MSSGLQVWSQTAATNATADSAVNWAEGMAPSAVNDSARAQMASMAKWRDDNNGTLVTTGSSAAFTVTSNQVEAALTDGYTVAVKFHSTVDSSATLSVDSLTAKPIQLIAGTNIGAGDIRGGTIQNLTYSSTGTGQWLVKSSRVGGVPAGVVSPYAGSSSPVGWLLCDGSAYSRATYADLFAAISTTYGSSDASTFKVPDITGRVIAGKEASATRLTTAIAGINGGTLGAAGGDQNIGAHTHTATSVVTDPGHVHNLNSNSGGTGSSTDTVPNANHTTGGANSAVASAATGITVATTVNSGGTGTSANIQPTIVLNYIIKT